MKQKPIVICARSGPGYKHSIVASAEMNCCICNHTIKMADSSWRAVSQAGFKVEEVQAICMQCAALAIETEEQAGGMINVQAITDEQIEEIRKNGMSDYMEFLAPILNRFPKKREELLKHLLKNI